METKVKGRVVYVEPNDFRNQIGGTFGNGIVSEMLSFAEKAIYESKKKRNCVTLVPFA